VLRFALPHESRATLGICDVAGHRVQLLANGLTSAGEHEMTWDARVPAGVFFVSLEAPERTLTRRVAVIP
jgi:hypothetical protein